MNNNHKTVNTMELNSCDITGYKKRIAVTSSFWHTNLWF